ncbi:ComEA family DNA-binding protein [Pseudomonas turukhanskensis]|uniref:Competence protein ComEA n=1 Tax=Pseudomonas turukhanskensis TaxID=1806536 RepID=A0A9W6K4Y6_9PSED|nr:ComEA family DNA-binding protein [Pseudomonas turukhanskensis]GLK88942.1 competence protein ComEA [Pseudomonas turukhanskensis]
MRIGYVSSLLFAALAFFSIGTSAAEPVKVEPAQSAVAQPARAPVAGALNLNTADAQALQTGLIGIGQVKAQAIVEYREANGPFTSVDELLEVKGIGASTLEKNRARLSLD